ncbi:MAG: hypothetical protein AB2A00_27415 [Myxococcota bacterium]
MGLMGRAVAGASLLLGLTACGPTGNSLGLDGRYNGTLKQVSRIKETLFLGFITTTSERTVTSETEGAVVVIGRGYDSDAIWITRDCDVPLKVNGTALVLQEKTECNESSTDATTGSNDKDEDTSTTVHRDATAESDGQPNTLKMEGESETTTISLSNGTKTRETITTTEWEFEGDKVAED